MAAAYYTEKNWLNVNKAVGTYVVFISFLFCCALSFICSFFPVPLVVQKNFDSFKSFRWRNLIISLLHSCIIGPWSLACFIAYFQEILHDALLHVNFPTYLVCCSAIGYFLYDSFDIILAGWIRQKWDVLLHHILIASISTYVVLTYTGAGYFLIGLLAEINSIFLHTRKLLQFAGFSRQNLLVKFNIFFNFATLVIFRLTPTIFLLAVVYKDGRRVPFPIAVCYVICVVLLMLMNFALLYQLIKADFGNCPTGPESKHLELRDQWVHQVNGQCAGDTTKNRSKKKKWY